MGVRPLQQHQEKAHQGEGRKMRDQISSVKMSFGNKQ
jgi:hypothetical protein